MPGKGVRTAARREQRRVITGLSISKATMTAPLKTVEGSGDIATTMSDIGRSAKAAARVLALASTDQKNRALAGMAAAIRASRSDILAANADDLADGEAAA